MTSEELGASARASPGFELDRLTSAITSRHDDEVRVRLDERLAEEAVRILWRLDDGEGDAYTMTGVGPRASVEYSMQ